MSSSFEKSVKGGTKIKLAPPKAKYVEHILLATHSGDAGLAEVFRTLENRLRDSTWTIAFKALIIVHLMIKEGEKDVTLKYLSQSPKTRLAVNQFTDVQTQGQNIRRYANYLLQRAISFADTRVDYVRPGAVDRMRTITIDKGLLRETSSIQDQIKALVKCDFFIQEPENEIALMAFRLITKDLLDLYTAMNQAVMNVLSHYFELSRVDAERSISIYKVFVKQTDQVVQYLSVARQYERSTRLEIPKIKHAPTSLAASLQEYLDDTDFDTNRRQYVAETQAKKSGRSTDRRPSEDAFASTKSRSTVASAPASRPVDSGASKPATKGPAPDLMDFFDSIEQNQQPMAQQAGQQYAQPAGMFAPVATQAYPQQPVPMNLQTNPYAQALPQQQMQQPVQQMQPNYTGMGFGGYGPQPTQQYASPTGFQDFNAQQAAATVQPQFSSPQAMQSQSTNPFRQSMMTTGTPTYQQQPAQPLQQQSTNPFARTASPTATGAPYQTMSAPLGTVQEQQAFSAPPMQPQQTGTNPFARAPQQQPAPSGPQSPIAPLSANVTGSTNPFRQSAFVNQQTGQGWQTTQQGTIGGWEQQQIQTVPVFPRPGQGQL